MKLEINHPKDEKNSEPIMRLELRHSSAGVDVVAIAKDGKKHFLLTLLSDGRFHRYVHIDEDSGFRLSKFGQLVECRNL